MVYTYYGGIQKEKRSKIPIIIAAAMVILLGLSLIAFQKAFAAPSSTVVYDALASVKPVTNYPSQPFQAQQTSEFGDYVHLAGTARNLDTITLTMSNWAKKATQANLDFCAAKTSNCDTTGFFWPITVNIYANSLTANDTPSTLLGSKTVTVHVPWRPTSDPSCGSTSNGTGWKVNNTCYDYSGIAFNASFDLSSLNLTLPKDVIVGFAYNTQSYGQQPTNIDGPYNSLNIAVPENNIAKVGSDDSATSTFWNTKTVSWYTNPVCQNQGGTFCKDTGWVYEGANIGTVPMRITATKQNHQCKDDGWKHQKNDDGHAFKNQGQCVSHFNHHDDNGRDNDHDKDR